MHLLPTKALLATALLVLSASLCAQTPPAQPARKASGIDALLGSVRNERDREM